MASETEPGKITSESTEEPGKQPYEMVLVITPEATEEAFESRLDSINQLISSHDGAVGDVERWGKKRLAYPINHYFEGHYALLRFEFPPQNCRDLEANLKISEDVLRHLLVKTAKT
jgi:small subunit ribosomal protein S6